MNSISDKCNHLKGKGVYVAAENRCEEGFEHISFFMNQPEAILHDPTAENKCAIQDDQISKLRFNRLKLKKLEIMETAQNLAYPCQFMVFAQIH